MRTPPKTKLLIFVFLGFFSVRNQFKEMMIFSAIREATAKTFVYSGRSERLEQWAFWFLTAFFGTSVMIVDRLSELVNKAPLNWVILGLGVWLLLGNISLMVRRLHDHSMSGFLLLVPLLFGTLWFFCLDMPPSESMTAFDYQLAPIAAMIGRFGFGGSSLMLFSMMLRVGEKTENRYGLPA